MTLELLVSLSYVRILKLKYLMYAFFGFVRLYGADFLLFKRSPPLRMIYIANATVICTSRWDAVIYTA